MALVVEMKAFKAPVLDCPFCGDITVSPPSITETVQQQWTKTSFRQLQNEFCILADSELQQKGYPQSATHLSRVSLSTEPRETPSKSCKLPLRDQRDDSSDELYNTFFCLHFWSCWSTYSFDIKAQGKGECSSGLSQPQAAVLQGSQELCMERFLLYLALRVHSLCF